MYCRYCGQLIEYDSIFCKHCGKQVSESVFLHAREKSDFYNSKNFFLSKNIIIAIIIYGIWFLFFIITQIVIAKSLDYRGDILMPFILCTIIFHVLSGWFIYKNKVEPPFENEIMVNNTAQDNPNRIYSKSPYNQDTRIIEDEQHLAEMPIPYKSENKLISKIEMLLPFSRQKGKMQVVNRGGNNLLQREHYCLFTDVNGATTRVEFSPQTEMLSPKDISEKKYQLCIEHHLDGTFTLNYVNDK